MPRRLLACLLIAALPLVARAQDASFSREEIRTMHDLGVKMALEGERSPYVVPADMDPARLVQAETIGFGGLDLHRLPPWLGRFNRMRYLDLSGTNIKAAQLKPLETMQVLEHLDLSNVALFTAGGDLNALWARLGNLRILKLAGTRGQAAQYGRLGQLANLVHLDLSGNGLNDLAPLDLKALKRLRTLDLSGNALGALDPGLLPANLTELNLSNTGLTRLSWSEGLDFPQLGQLKLGGNRGLQIDEVWGDVFLMQRLLAVEHDSDVQVPKGWRTKLARHQLEAFKQALPGRMVAIKAGCFQMGSPASEKGRNDDELEHQVCLEAFEIGKYEVTFAEYDLFCEATGRGKPANQGWGRGDRPVVNVSWHDAMAYADWVGQVAGGHYRLPSEVEWEYAARAGTATAYWWGEDIGRNHASCDGCGSQWDNNQMAPVGSFPANPWGLHDTAGNVWEWTCSGYGAYDGKLENTCAGKDEASPRVLRGGSWRSNPYYCRAADRFYVTPDHRVYAFGFRVVRVVSARTP